MKMPSPLVPLAFALLLATAACGDDPLTPLGPEDVTFAPELGVDLDQMTKLPTGVYIQTLTVGLGSRTVEASDEVEVAYTLWLPDGTEVQQGETSGPVTGFIPGFRDGVMGMVEGEVRLIVIPSERGYGAEAQPGIPPNSVLVFRVELLDIPTSS